MFSTFFDVDEWIEHLQGNTVIIQNSIIRQTS